MEKIYKSKIGIEIKIPILLILSFCFYKTMVTPKIPAITIGVLVFAFIIYTFASIKYIIYNENLNIKGGFFVNEDIDIQSILKIEKTFNILSAPAASLDRIEIKYGQGNSILISPKNKTEFVNELLKINPNIEVKL